MNWTRVTSLSKTTPTLQVVVNPPLRRGTPVHDNAFQSLKDLGADYVRYVPWLPYPKLGVAELEPPRDGRTSWDFTFIDPMTIDFLEATKGHSSILNFSTIPQWMVKTEKPVSYPADPDGVTWTYTQGSDFRDPTFKEVADYYARLLAWYTKGGFTDELGKRHESGHHYRVAYWEVLNEIELERDLSPEAYAKLYDAVVTAMKAVSPETKFVGLALAFPGKYPNQFEYFLDPKHHKPGVPLDFISYHFYAVPTPDQGPDVQTHVFFAQADGFLNTVRYVGSRSGSGCPQRRAPRSTRSVRSPADDLMQSDPSHVAQPIPASYWNLTCAMYAYLFGELTRIGIDVVGESQLSAIPAVPERVDARLDERQAEPAPLDLEAAEGQSRTRGQARGDEARQPVPLRDGGREARRQAAPAARQQAREGRGARGCGSLGRTPGLRRRDHPLRSAGIPEAGRGQGHAARAGGRGVDAALGRRS